MKYADTLVVMLKGCAMGMADVVPGVSGGTIAFISGIYGTLIESIKSVDMEALKLLCRFRLREFWRKINGGFLAALVAGIGISVFSVARLMTWLLAHHPIGVWSFFFGLIIASSILVFKEVRRWNAGSVAALAAGVAAAWAVTSAAPSSTPETWWFIVLSGAVAICAMILPGISGAFILLLLGKYRFIMQAVGSFDIPVLLLFAAGALAGIASFSRLLSWLLARWHDITVALLMGFMVGSLNKIWPWKRVVETYVSSHGEVRPLVEANVSPGRFAGDPQLLQAVLMCIAGFVLILGIDYLGTLAARRREERK